MEGRPNVERVIRSETVIAHQCGNPRCNEIDCDLGRWDHGKNGSPRGLCLIEKRLGPSSRSSVASVPLPVPGVTFLQRDLEDRLGKLQLQQAAVDESPTLPQPSGRGNRCKPSAAAVTRAEPRRENSCREVPARGPARSNPRTSKRPSVMEAARRAALTCRGPSERS